jgi:hypothetical protein
VDDPRERGTDKSIPPETVAGRERLGRGLGLLWIGIFVAAVLLVVLLAWLLS